MTAKGTQRRRSKRRQRVDRYSVPASPVGARSDRVTETLLAIRADLLGTLNRIEAALHLFGTVRRDAERVVALRPLLAELDRRAGRSLTPAALRRTADRWRLLRRYAELRAMPANRDRSNDCLVRQVVEEAPQLLPGVQCSTRSMRRWLREWNKADAGGLAGGLTAILDARGRPSPEPFLSGD
jgi:hypothetical protein